MAKPSERELSYTASVTAMTWDDLDSLWSSIKAGATPGWNPGKALEYLIVRGFELSGLKVRYPFEVPPGGPPLEQIDGVVYLDRLPFLLECKDRDKADIEAIAKLRNQLLRRPDTAFGCVFVVGTFTNSALVLADYAVPQRILLWPGRDIEEGITKRDFGGILEAKYANLCEYGLTDQSPNFQDLLLDS